ncbi:MAG: hypothetical protein JWM19_4979, partial [Actinomycetia bacterium]|nr:hypothetical protein [Actinomycetes bacterium]
RAKPVQGRWRADGSGCQPFGVERAAGPALTLAVGPVAVAASMFPAAARRDGGRLFAQAQTSEPTAIPSLTTAYDVSSS